MKQEQFKVTNYIKELAVNADKYLVNFPNKQIELKHKIIDATYDLLLLTYKANATRNLDKRLDIQEECIAHVKFIDFMYDLAYEKKLIDAKKYRKFGENLGTIGMYMGGWKRATEEMKRKEEK